VEASSQRTAQLGRLSWTEVEEAVAEDPVILLPIGTVEQHGPHLPVNADNMVAEYVASRAAERTNALVAPAINYGCSEVYRRFAGTVSVRQETLAAMVRDVCKSFVAQGFRRIVFVNNHGGNEPACEQVARELGQEHGLVVGSVYPWKLGYLLMRDSYEDPNTSYGHGAEPETSAMMAMFPEDVVEDRMESGSYVPFAGWRPRGYSTVDVPGQKVGGTIYLDARDISPNGVTGDPGVASAELGEAWVEGVVGFTVEFVEHYDRVTSGVAEKTGMEDRI